MRIALVSETWLPQINGVSRTLDRLARYLEACGDRLLVLAPRYEQAVAAPGKREAGSYAAIRLPCYREVLLPFVSPARLQRRLAAFAPDLLHIATEGPLGWSALQAARRLRLPVVSSYHTNFAQYLASYRLGPLEPLAWRYLRGFHNRTALTLCPTPSIAGMLEARGFANLAIWSRGVDAGHFHPQHRDPELRRSLGIAADEVAILYVGRLAAEKNLAALFAACRQLVGKVRLLLVGDGPLRGTLEGERLPGATFTGYHQGEELARLYAAADLFAFPSCSETFGNVILEAAASGLPTVAFTVPGPRDILRDGETGLLVAEGDTAGLAAALQLLVDDDDLRRQLGRAARAYAEDQDWDGINRGVRDHYRRLAAGRSDAEVTSAKLAAPAGENHSC